MGCAFSARGQLAVTGPSIQVITGVFAVRLSASQPNSAFSESGAFGVLHRKFPRGS